MWSKLGWATSHDRAGYAVSTVSAEHTAMMGQRPMRSDSAPMTGSQMKFDRPMHKVTSRLSSVLSLSTFLPKVGV
ncbi:hypothetical protein D3C72_1936800 [compost metagenome]